MVQGPSTPYPDTVYRDYRVSIYDCSLTWSLQVPELRQGAEAHSSMLTEQSTPEKKDQNII